METAEPHVILTVSHLTGESLELAILYSTIVSVTGVISDIWVQAPQAQLSLDGNVLPLDHLHGDEPGTACGIGSHMILKQLVIITITFKLFADPALWIILRSLKESARQCRLLNNLLSSLLITFIRLVDDRPHSSCSTRRNLVAIHLTHPPCLVPKGAKHDQYCLQLLLPVALHLLQLLHQGEGEQAEHIVEGVLTEGLIGQVFIPLS